VFAEIEALGFVAGWASSIPLRVSLVPPDFEMTTVRVLRARDRGKGLVEAVRVGVVQEMELKASAFVPSASAIN